MSELGYCEGDTCGRDGCDGVIESHRVVNCSCHISPPCGACTAPRGYCEACGWEESEDPPPAPEAYKGKPWQPPEPRPLDPSKVDWRFVPHTAMGALQAAQLQYDNRLPLAVSESPAESAEQAWIGDGIAELMARRDYVFQRRMRQKQGVTYERFAQAVDEFVMGQLGLNGISNSVLGRLVLAARCKVTSDAKAAAEEILSVANPESALEEIARQLLTPFAKEGVLAQAEEAQ